MGVHDEDVVFIDVSSEEIESKNVDWNSGELDDSGIVEDYENKVIELDDDAFKHLQERLEKLRSEDLRIKPCYVGIYKFPVFFEDDDDQVQTERGGRARSGNERKSRKKSEENLRRSRRVSLKISNIDQKQRNNSLTKKTDKLRDAGKRLEPLIRNQGRRKEKITIIELDSEDEFEDDYTKIVPRLRIKIPQTGAKLPEVKEELSEYERIREENIKERREMLKSLGLNTDLQQLKNNSSSTRKDRKRRLDTFSVERRKSARLASRDDEEEYLPDPDDLSPDDPLDHDHQGARRHPCRECSNCLKPDCGRCVFCRDKKKFGGRNIKKQRCEYKESCSNPIINGTKRQILCHICNETFPQTYLLDHHKEKVHDIEQVRRRSSRLSEQKSKLGNEDSESSGEERNL